MYLGFAQILRDSTNIERILSIYNNQSLIQRIMNSPTFKNSARESGFIRKKSQDSYREAFKRPLATTQLIQTYRQQNNYFQKNYYPRNELRHRDPESSLQSSSMSSDFDKFQLRPTEEEPLSTNRNKKNQSSFQLSPYQHDSESKLQSSRDYRRQRQNFIMPQNNQRLKQKMNQKSQSSQLSQEQIDRYVHKDNRLKQNSKRIIYFDKKKQAKNRKQNNSKSNKYLRQQQKIRTKNELQEKYNRLISSESDFSLQSDKFQQFIKQKPIEKVKQNRRSHSNENNLNEIYKPSLQSNTSNFLKHSKQELQQKELTSQEQSVQQKELSRHQEINTQTEPEQLITQYDVKGFKSFQKSINLKMNQKPALKSNPIRQVPPRPQKHGSIDIVQQKPKLPPHPSNNKLHNKFVIEKDFQPQIIQNKKKSLKFQIDVQKKNLTLAEAFEINCGRLKNRLENQRQQFARKSIQSREAHEQQNDKNVGNRIQKYGRVAQKEKYSEPNIDYYQPKPTPKPNIKVQRLAMGIKAPVSKRQMFDMTLKKYKQLPEVKNKVNQQRKKQDLVRRLQNVKKLDREVRSRLKYH